MKIKSITYGFKTDHSAASYTFLSLKKLSKEEREGAASLIRKLAGEDRSVGEDAIIIYESWELYSDELENMLLDKYFDIELRSNETLANEILKLSLDYNEELYQKLRACEGYGDYLTSIWITKTDRKIILTIKFYFNPKFKRDDSYDERERKLHKFLKDLREDISKGDLTALRVIGEFYDITSYKGKINWKELGTPTKNAKLLKKMLVKKREL